MFFCLFLGVFSVPFSKTVHHHDKVDEFQLALIEDGTRSQGSCQIALQASPVFFLLLDLVIPFNGVIALMARTSF